MNNNPLLDLWPDLPPFNRIDPAHFLPAFNSAVILHLEEINAIAENPQPADFVNTILEFEYSGKHLKQVLEVLSNLSAAHTNDQIQDAERSINPASAAHESRILTDSTLFKRVNSVYNSRHDQGISGEDLTLLEETFRKFTRAGAQLDLDGRAQVTHLTEQISTLSTHFAQNLIKATNEFELVLKSSDELTGLPQSVLDASKALADERGYAEGHLFTTSRGSFTPFMEFSDRRQ